MGIHFIREFSFLVNHSLLFVIKIVHPIRQNIFGLPKTYFSLCVIYAVSDKFFSAFSLFFVSHPVILIYEIKCLNKIKFGHQKET